MIAKRFERPFQAYTKALVWLSCLSTSLLILGALRGGGLTDWYLLWNLLLAWIPLLLAYELVRMLRHKAWSSWTGISLSLAWLLFLPNSFYIVSDLIHLEDIARENVLFDALTFTLFVLAGLALGYSSLFLVQRELAKRFGRLRGELFAALMLLLSSFAIYLGRDLRWNSWDVLLNPAGIIFDVSERVIDPLDHPEAFTTTLMFFIFLAGLYIFLRQVALAVADLIRTK